MDKTSLLTALKLTQPALGGELIKGLSSFHFDGNTVTAFNGMLMLKATMDFEFPVRGSIEGETFYKLIGELGKEIELSAESTDQLRVKSGRSKSYFPVEDIDLTMLEDVEETEGDLHLPTTILFAGGIKRCLNSVGGKGIPQEEIGIHVFVENGQCCMYATNISTFSRFQFPVETDEKYQVFLPAAFAEQLLFVYNELGDHPDDIRVSQKYVRANFKNVSLRSSFYSNPVNLKLRRQVDEGIAEIGLITIPEELIESIKRSETVAGGSKITLSLEGEEARLHVTATGAKQQKFYEEVVLNEAYPFSSPPLRLDIKALKKMLPSCKEMGFGENYILMIGNEDYYDYVVTSHVE